MLSLIRVAYATSECSEEHVQTQNHRCSHTQCMVVDNGVCRRDTRLLLSVHVQLNLCKTATLKETKNCVSRPINA